MTSSERKTEPKPETVLGYERQNINGIFQVMRGKKNLVYKNSEGQEVVAKFVRFREGIRDNVAGMKRERELLEMLADTGVTPKVLEFKEYPDQKKVRLLLEKLPGKSFDKMSDTEKSALLSKRAEEVIFSTASSLEKVHQKGVLVVDLNEGTFLIDEGEQGVTCYVLDFELGASIEPRIENEIEFAAKWFSRKDFALKLDDGLDCKNPEVLTKSELYLWASVLVQEMIGLSRIQETMTLPEKVQEIVNKETVFLEAKLKEEVIENLKTKYTMLIKRNPEQIADYGLESDFVKKNFESEFQKKIQTVLLGITLEEKLKKTGIDLSTKSLKFLKACLSLDFAQRPKNFLPLLS